MNSSIFNRMGEIAFGARSRVAKEHEDFLALMKQLVETSSAETVEMFGSLGGIAITKKDGTKIDNYGILLTVADYLFWKEEIANGSRFTYGVAKVKNLMLRHLAKKIETYPLEATERKALLALVEEGEA